MHFWLENGWLRYAPSRNDVFAWIGSPDGVGPEGGFREIVGPDLVESEKGLRYRLVYDPQDFEASVRLEVA